MLAGFLAFRGYMQLDTVILTAFLGSYAGDQLWYFLGRRHGRRLLARKPRWQKLGDKALDHVRRHPDLWVLSFRFVYGLRTVMPVAIGLSGYPPARYLLLNGIGAIVWAAALGSAAYYFGSVLEGMLGNIKIRTHGPRRPDRAGPAALAMAAFQDTARQRRGRQRRQIRVNPRRRD